MKKVMAFAILLVIAYCLYSCLNCPQAYAPLSPPSLKHLLGTTPLGQDALCYSLKGSWASLETALASSITSLTIMVSISLLSMYLKAETLDGILGLFAGFPRFSFLVFLALVTTLNPLIIGFIVGTFSSIAASRSLVSKVKQLRESEFCKASEALGASNFHLFRYHCLPHITSFLKRYVAISSAIAVYAEAGFSMLGLEDPSIPSIGKLFALVESTPGAILAEAGQLQALTSAVMTVFIGLMVYYLLK